MALPCRLPSRYLIRGALLINVGCVARRSQELSESCVGSAIDHIGLTYDPRYTLEAWFHTHRGTKVNNHDSQHDNDRRWVQKSLILA